MFIGDSHALGYFTSVKESPHLRGFYFGSGGCPFGLDTETLSYLGCAAFRSVLIEAILENSPDILVLASRWRSYSHRLGCNLADLLGEAERYALGLPFEGGIYVLTEPPKYAVAIPHLVLQRLGGVLGLTNISDSDQLRSKNLTIECPREDEFDRGTANVTVVDVSKWFRSGEKCLIFSNRKMLYRDSLHLTSYGSTEVLGRIFDINFE